MFSGVLSFSAHSLFSHALLCGKSSGGQISTFQVTNITPPGKSASWLSTNGGRAAVRNRAGLAGQSWTSGRVAADFSSGVKPMPSQGMAAYRRARKAGCSKHERVVPPALDSGSTGGAQQTVRRCSEC
ncbi:hypothetical protein VFPPC_18132 [Pochonia chlamydosporia 170]|uniref:Uncharacterized protein n=1 Tax=Pochonia chlamydosporia 170 TaxID=1380566 RepID=A0A219AQ31_METCM|nr:hypothetical protein VFPPC_18132 [Pochonia chlamydosporia 170]OWT42719.1 hypothetical protein VFPPC_18132 [Pochonia chlamydosporia 170]